MKNKKTKTIGILSGIAVVAFIAILATTIKLNPDIEVLPVTKTESITSDSIPDTAKPISESTETTAITTTAQTTSITTTTVETTTSTATEEPPVTITETEPSSTEATTIPKTEPVVIDTEPITVTAQEVILAPVAVPSKEEISILEENDIQVVENTFTSQTTPPPGKPKDAQATDENGHYVKRENGVKYVWVPVLGWVKDSENGSTEIMDVESDGYMFYEEPDGTINLDKVVAPDGKIITYEEYQEIKNQR